MAFLRDPYETPTKLGLGASTIVSVCENFDYNLDIVSNAILSIRWLEQVKP